MVLMGRSIAKRILEDLEGEEGEGSYFALYDFKEKPPNQFYKNLHRIFKALDDGARIQASVYRCRYLKTAKAIRALCRHYGAEVLLFSAEVIE